MKAFVLALLLAGQASADTGTMCIWGTGAGTLGGVPFEGTVVFAAVYDTNDVVAEMPGRDWRQWRAPILYAAVTTDAGQADILADGQVASYSQDHPERGPPSGLYMPFPGFTVDGGLPDFFLNYDLSYTFGPVQIYFLPPPPVGYLTYVIETSAGELVMDPERQDIRDWMAYVEVQPE